ncbi:tRNA(NNU) t(6)A37 threonylcarbamoyladenosine modification; ADP binding protein [Petrocella atlantisensis]|uniref:tRNA threonylcarbamoyladenosine biosynthesis protein TsaE n=1 Tax=Petrocella atlantisensis TaxID=2173034 RepID=A0A3P7NZY9_9FIRM|nr:tRNA (adenosine(37)-N6)-threonylcarbamoyltransferase complex ATPase subunit type 1 TsaE [Petrocella atlantisensis]VDN46880.1 tRNA(NNU) t(6)A37 threonylcarbamoyladenosine modification; ADP binding protein [Petrocella atlantisensis]
MNKKIYESITEAETQAIGEKLGMEAKQGEVYCLDGELGVGKTVFTKGFAKGLSIHEHVTSPTFTILNLYESGRLHFYHFDVYRISDPYELEEIGYEDYFFGQGVTMVEWASRIEELIPKEARYITIEKDLSKGLDYRTITIEEGD